MKSIFGLLLVYALVNVVVSDPANLWASKIHTIGDQLQGWARGACIYYSDQCAGSKLEELQSERLVFASGLNENWDENRIQVTSNVQVFAPYTNVSKVWVFNETVADGITAPKPRGFNTGWSVKDGFEQFAGARLAWCDLARYPNCTNPPNDPSQSEFFSDVWRFNLTSGKWVKRTITGRVPGVFTINTGSGNMEIAVGVMGVESYQHSADDVYLFGGLTVNPLNGEFVLYNDVYHYDVSSGVMTLLDVPEPKPQPRLYTSMVGSPKGFMITGGELLIQDATDPLLWEFNINTRRWKLRDGVQQSPTVQLMGISNWKLGNEKKFYFCGGDTNSTSNPCGYFRPAFPSNKCQVYQYGKDKFTSFSPSGDPNFPALKRQCQWTSLNKNIYIQGGWYINPSNPSDCQIFNADMWALRPFDPEDD